MAKRKPNTALAEESKRDKFIRLAEKRTNMAVKYINMLGGLATPAYEYTGVDAELIIAELNAAIHSVEVRFAGGKVVDGGFRLKQGK